MENHQNSLSKKLWVPSTHFLDLKNLKFFFRNIESIAIGYRWHVYSQNTYKFYFFGNLINRPFSGPDIWKKKFFFLVNLAIGYFVKKCQLCWIKKNLNLSQSFYALPSIFLVSNRSGLRGSKLQQTHACPRSMKLSCIFSIFFFLFSPSNYCLVHFLRARFVEPSANVRTTRLAELVFFLIFILFFNFVWNLIYRLRTSRCTWAGG